MMYQVLMKLIILLFKSRVIEKYVLNEKLCPPSHLTDIPSDKLASKHYEFYKCIRNMTSVILSSSLQVTLTIK